MAPAIGRMVEGFAGWMGGNALLAAGEEQIAGFARHGINPGIVARKGRDLSVENLGPGGAAVGTFVDAALIIQVEGIGQHAIGSDGSLVKVIGPVKVVPVGDAGKNDRVPGLTSILGVTGATPFAGAQTMSVGELAAMVPPMVLPANEGMVGNRLPGLAAIGGIAGLLDPPPIGDPDQKVRVAGGIIDRPAGGKVSRHD